MRVAVHSSASKPYLVKGVKGGFAPLHPLRGRGCPPSSGRREIQPTTLRPLPGRLGAFLGVSCCPPPDRPASRPPGARLRPAGVPPCGRIGGGRRARRHGRPLVYVTIFARSPGGGWFEDTKKPGLADTKTGRNLAGKEAPYREKEDTTRGVCSL